MMRGPRTTVQGPGTPVLIIQVKNVSRACVIAHDMGWTVERTDSTEVRIKAVITKQIPSVDRALTAFWAKYNI